jgi:hypothetical protein
MSCDPRQKHCLRMVHTYIPTSLTVAPFNIIFYEIEKQNVTTTQYSSAQFTNISADNDCSSRLASSFEYLQVQRNLSNPNPHSSELTYSTN